MDAELFQVKAQLERALSAKLDEMLNLQKTASDKTDSGYDHPISSHNKSTKAHNKVIFIRLANNDNFEDNEPKTESASESKNDKGISTLGAPPKTVKKETKQNGRRFTSKNSQPKKPHFCHHCGASRHTRPNCYKWLATQQSNSVSSFCSQNKLQLSLASLGELLKAVMLLLNFNGFNSPSYPPK